MNKQKLIELGLTEEQANKPIEISKQEISGNYIPKSRFDEVNEQLKQAKQDITTRDNQLEELKKVDADSLKEQIKTLQAENKANAEKNEATIKQLKIDNAVEMALLNAKAKNSKAVKALLNLENAELDEKGVVKDLDKQIKELMKDESSSFLFEQQQTTFKGVKPADGKTDPQTQDTSKMNYGELCDYLAQNSQQ